MYYYCMETVPDAQEQLSDTQALSGRLTDSESAIMMPRLAAGLAAAPDFKAGQATGAESDPPSFKFRESAS